jgi:hypothetical protein
VEDMVMTSAILVTYKGIKQYEGKVA